MQKESSELSKIVDVAERMKNWTESSGELEEAKEDLRGDLKACVEDDPIASCGCMLSGSILWKIYQWAYYTNNFEAVIGPLVMKKIEPKGNAVRVNNAHRKTDRPWKRDDTVTRRKNARLAYLDRRYKGDRASEASSYGKGVRAVVLQYPDHPMKLVDSTTRAGRVLQGKLAPHPGAQARALLIAKFRDHAPEGSPQAKPDLAPKAHYREVPLCSTRLWAFCRVSILVILPARDTVSDLPGLLLRCMWSWRACGPQLAAWLPPPAICKDAQGHP
ncbi:hypothetical protein AK812_SmicGene45081 [Symbiodinium microadriaticum]|uniref:Uncharacterized protein n=1 Tax=Symbiodinium microadriaticum TaxID=2951 RepID=A0A1Q9BWX1_SYMMI|nr:hypothetical protein AK812_SmicGene45081 [Symbiodinium microadriaticum]